MDQRSNTSEASRGRRPNRNRRRTSLWIAEAGLEEAAQAAEEHQVPPSEILRLWLTLGNGKWRHMTAAARRKALDAASNPDGDGATADAV